LFVAERRRADRLRPATGLVGEKLRPDVGASQRIPLLQGAVPAPVRQRSGARAWTAANDDQKCDRNVGGGQGSNSGLRRAAGGCRFGPYLTAVFSVASPC